MYSERYCTLRKLDPNQETVRRREAFGMCTTLKLFCTNHMTNNSVRRNRRRTTNSIRSKEEETRITWTNPRGMSPDTNHYSSLCKVRFKAKRVWDAAGIPGHVILVIGVVSPQQN